MMQMWKPGAEAWRGAIWALSLAVLVFGLVSAYGFFQDMDAGRAIIGGVAFLVAVFVAGTIVAGLLGLLRLVPFRYLWVLAVALILLALLALRILMALTGVVLFSMWMVVTFSLLGAAVVVLARPRAATLRLHRWMAWGALAVSLALGGAGMAWLLQPGAPMDWPPNAAQESAAHVATLTLADPSQPGPYPVRTLCYGQESGRWRGACEAATYISTNPVDGSAFLQAWGALRRSYWGFGPDALPLNARVWHPDGAGPFPLVLIVHGNAPMEKWSDQGYAYLGELWASRGFVAASMDENFLNLSHMADLIYFDRLSNENDARAWLLLEHLRLWHGWQNDASHPLSNQLNLDQIALVGHSRGGEAVAIAAAFNQLSHYPDDARVAFDYGYHIRAVLAIAPSEGQYMPSLVDNPLENVNYLVVHGAHDMDVITYMGARQFNRTRFTGDAFHFRAGLYIIGANHGQFNTVWGYDLRAPARWLYNERQLIAPDTQQQIARVYFTAFLETTLRGEVGFLPLFRDARVAPDWLPAGIYLNQYADSDTRWLSAYEEDIDPATTTWPGGRIEAAGLTVWREQIVPARWEDMANKAVYLGWDAASRDLSESPAFYAVHLPDASSDHALAVQAHETLVLDLAATDENAQGALIDLTVELVDRRGAPARVPLSHFSPIQPPLEAVVTKARFFYVLPLSEIVFQTFAFPLEDFAAANPDFRLEELETIRLVFDRTPAGEIVLDNVGVR